MPFAKGQSGNPKGRRKGTPNKITADIKDALIAAANAAGGEGGMTGYFTELAKNNPNAFASLIGRIIPMQVSGDPEAPAPIVRVERVVVDARKRTPEEEFPTRALG